MLPQKVDWDKGIKIEDIPDWICLCDVKGIYWEPRLFIDCKGLKRGLKRLEELL